MTTRAAAAGYAWPDKQGSRLLSYPAVARELKARFAARREQREAERKGRDREWKAKKAADDASRAGRLRRRGRYKPRQKCM